MTEMEKKDIEKMKHQIIELNSYIEHLRKTCDERIDNLVDNITSICELRIQYEEDKVDCNIFKKLKKKK